MCGGGAGGATLQVTRRKAALVSVLTGVGLAVVGGLLLMGLPAAVVLLAVEPVIAWLWQVSPEAMFPRDSGWPFMIINSLLFGLLVPPAVLLPWRLAGWRYTAAVPAMLALGMPLVMLAMYAIGIAPGLNPG